jgi:hypothetical protein
LNDRFAHSLAVAGLRVVDPKRSFGQRNIADDKSANFVRTLNPPLLRSSGVLQALQRTEIAQDAGHRNGPVPFAMNVEIGLRRSPAV